MVRTVSHNPYIIYEDGIFKFCGVNFALIM